MEKYFAAKLTGDTVAIDGDSSANFNEGGEVSAGWTWNGSTLRIENDRYGFYPMYYASGPDFIAVSPSIAELLEIGVSREIDFDALSVLVRIGSCIGDDTAFKAIRMVPPNSVLNWENGQIEIHQTKLTQPDLFTGTRDEAIGIYAALFQAAVERTVPAEEPLLPLSGGRDSRHILLALYKAGRKPTCFTALHVPPRRNEDARIAAILCERLGVRHEVVEQPKSRFAAELIKNERTGYGVQEHGWFLVFADRVKAEFRYAYDGIAGDVLSSGHFQTTENLRWFEDGDYANLAEQALGREGYTPLLLTREARGKLSRDRAIAHVIKELEKHADARDPIASYYLYNRARRGVAVSPFNLFGETVTTLTPYLDEELYDFLVSLPPSMMLDRQFHTDTITYAHPEFADVPYEGKASPLDVYDRGHFTRFAAEILRYAMTPRRLKLADRSFVLSRCVRAIVDKSYAPSVTAFGEQAVHLLQLERV